MTAPIRLSKCSLATREIEAAIRIMRAEFLGMGPEVKAFEEELATYIGGERRQVVCVNTGTAALHLALSACGVGPGDEVLVPTLTYVASFQAIAATGAVPVACDIDPVHAFIDPRDARSRITERTRAIMPVHYASGCGDLDGIYRLAREHSLRVVEDAAQSFGCRRNERPVGADGDVVCFSFDGIKNITCGEGGAVVTADEAVAAAVRDARLLGVQNDSEKRYSGTRSWEFDVTAQGWRYHMSDLFAAIGRVQLSRLDGEFAPRRVETARRYHALLADCPNITCFDFDYGPIVPHIFPVRVLDGRRDEVLAQMKAKGIGCGLHYKPNHLLSYFGGGRPILPVAEKLYRELLTLPLHVDLTETDQRRIVEALRSAVASP